MKLGKTWTDLTALRREALHDLEETSDEELRQEGVADGDDLDVVASDTISTLRAAVASAYRSGSVFLTESRPRDESQEASNAESLTHGELGLRRPDRLRWGAGVAVAATLVGIAVVSMELHHEVRTPQTYKTATGESRTVVFPDGSTATLNTRTQITWVGTGRERRIRLKNGEALFEVTHDKGRPFRIDVDRSEIRVLGTQFDVYRKTNGTTVVTVLEGAVSVQGLADGNAPPVWVRSLTRNEQVEYAGSKLLADVHRTEATAAIAWREGTIVVDDGTLRDLVNELNRYSARPIILARDPRLERDHITGVLSTRNMDTALEVLRLNIPNLNVLRTPDGSIVLSYRTGSQPSNSSDVTGGP